MLVQQSEKLSVLQRMSLLCVFIVLLQLLKPFSRSSYNSHASDFSRAPSQPLHFTDTVTVIYTAGQPRSGSTFQQVLLCAIAHLRSKSVSCSHTNAHLVVTKMHPRNSKIQLGKTSMLFTTVRDEDFWRKQNFTWRGRPVAYTQKYREFVRCPLCEIYNYKELFALTNDEILQLTQYMRYWSILRQCCGSQLSKWQRAELVGCLEAHDFRVEGKLEGWSKNTMMITILIL